MDSHKQHHLEQHYYDVGYDETIKFILTSKKEQYLSTTKDIYKIKELLSLTKGEKSIVQFLNYLEDKKHTIVPSYYTSINIIYDSTNVSKLSARQLKHISAKVNNLNPKDLAFYKSFIGMIELDTDGLTLERVKVKASKIRALYTANVPNCNLDFMKVLAALKSLGIKSSEQDVIAFLSLLMELSYDAINVNIPASFWESIFGRRHIKEAKQVFQDLGILTLFSNSIPGFKSAGYKINLCDAQNAEVRPPLVVRITSIKTLEKLNRIKKYKGNFTLCEKIEALKLIRDLSLNHLKKLGKTNLTDVFLESGKTQKLIDDIKRMNNIINDNRFYHIALALGIHLTTYFNNISRGNYKDYKVYYHIENHEIKI